MKTAENAGKSGWDSIIPEMHNPPIKIGATRCSFLVHGRENGFIAFLFRYQKRITYPRVIPENNTNKNPVNLNPYTKQTSPLMIKDKLRTRAIRIRL